MGSSLRFSVLALLGALLVSGCALRDPRDSYAYGRVADGLWDADYDILIDWNYPTSANQGRLEAPKRFRPEKPAIGVPWATGNPIAPPKDTAQAPALEASAPAPAHEVSNDEDTPSAARGEDARGDARAAVAVRGERARR